MKTRPTLGDRVRVICGDGQSRWVGRVGTIVEDEKDHQPYNVRTDKGETRWFHEESVELIEDAPQEQKFKVGDRVEFLEDHERNGAGTFAEVMVVDDYRITVRTDGSFGWNARMQGYNFGGKGWYIRKSCWYKLRKIEDKTPLCEMKDTLVDDMSYMTLYISELDKMRGKIITPEKTKTKPKTMNTIKNIFKSKEDKAMEYFGLGSSNELTDKGRQEFIDFVYETGTADKKEFLKKIVEAHKEDTK